MKNRIIATFIVLIFALASVYASSADVQTVEFPNITVFDKDGNVVNLTDFRGKPVVLNFWASWCGPCKNEMPTFDEVYKEVGNDVYFVMVDMTDGVRETVESGSAYVEKMGYSFPVYYDTAQNAAYTLGISSIPMTIFLDAKGHGVTYYIGALNKDALLYGIDVVKNHK
ncbi:MAG: TlpA family protein disulfide reductase [Spirochaetales bacterium]|nr:TlpA family protein disulfide reductase [Spirochaetales bacterium]